MNTFELYSEKSDFSIKRDGKEIFLTNGEFLRAYTTFSCTSIENGLIKVLEYLAENNQNVTFENLALAFEKMDPFEENFDISNIKDFSDLAGDIKINASDLLDSPYAITTIIDKWHFDYGIISAIEKGEDVIASLVMALKSGENFYNDFIKGDFTNEGIVIRMKYQFGISDYNLANIDYIRNNLNVQKRNIMNFKNFYQSIYKKISRSIVMDFAGTITKDEIKELMIKYHFNWLIISLCEMTNQFKTA